MQTRKGPSTNLIGGRPPATIAHPVCRAVLLVIAGLDGYTSRYSQMRWRFIISAFAAPVEIRPEEMSFFGATSERGCRCLILSSRTGTGARD
jgi:hypothetical protein